ncbi:MAG TPA: 5-formyltetrahydrofolate cyclo-ligase [Polyangiaceae bacterium]|jgi:5-formyltetrahydrofolate cyclo-ligase
MPQTPNNHHGFIPSSEEEMLRRRVKAELRKRMRGLRGTLPATACSERSERIAERLLSLEPIARGRSIALFWPMTGRREVDLRSLDERLRRRGARVAYPAVADDGSGSMTFRFVGDPGSMPEDPALGVRQPGPDQPEVAPGELDAIVVPALAVDPSGHRIGYGGGYYDRALPRFAPPATTVAVAFDFQLLVEVPWTAGDVRVEHVVTDARTLAVTSP